MMCFLTFFLQEIRKNKSSFKMQVTKSRAGENKYNPVASDGDKSRAPFEMTVLSM